MKRLPTYPDSDLPLPTTAELEILRVIWLQGRGTVGSVHFALNEQRVRGYTTVLKLMQIMMAKRLLERLEGERIHFYGPLVGEAETRAAFIADAAGKLFAGSLPDMIAFAIDMVASGRRSDPASRRQPSDSADPFKPPIKREI